ncbi:hypothetical protein Bca52824_095279, partial [Brassica carinata]
SHTICHPGRLTISSFVQKPLHDVLGFRKEINGTTVDVALQWCSDAYSDTMLGYANSIRTIDGGTHIEGVKASLTRTLNSLAKKLKVIKEKDISLSGEHVREGLTCIVSVKVPDPEFEGQTKTRLGNPEVRKIVDQSLQEYLTEYLELHPDVLESIISKSLNAYKAALAAKRARELVRSKSILKSSSLPGKLADCSSTDPAASEIFIVEGDSAGGSAKQGRDRRFQAILPLRGKILNIERKDEAAMYKNEEIQNLILGLGLGVKGEDFNMENLRYHKIIILTDADVDGAHIRSLLLTFFFRYQRALFDAGCIYVGVPPLFKVERGKQAHYCYDEAALKQVIASFPGNASYNIQRFKGLGEMMPEQLWETTMDPDTRILKQLVVDDAAETNVVFSSLMGAREKDISLSGEHVREGLTCIVSVKVPDPEFEGQTKTRLGNPEVRKIVDQSLQEYLTEYFELHPDVLESIISKSLNAYKAALAAKRARELVRSKSILKSSSLPGKLADCSSTDPAESEIFIVEGDSAGGSAKQGRDRRFQAILPLRGKILNIERKDEAAMYKNEEIQNLILGLGLGVKGEDFNMENLRYHKIIILTDADVDGAHIRTLLLTFFFRYQRALFDAGCIYVGVPPLFKVERGKQAHYCYDEAALKQVIASFPGNASYNIQRFKGLGEMMPEQLWETTMNPDTRILKQLVVDDAAETNMVFSSLMGARVDVRKELIKSAATRINLEHLDI